MRLKGKVAIITGGGRGIGRAIALALAQEGCGIIITSRTLTELEDAKKEIIKSGGEAIAVKGDVQSASDAGKIIKSAVKKFGRIDILVNNAGVAYYKPFSETSEKDYDTTLDTNLKGTFLFIKETLPYMLKQKSGVIINISSMAGKRGYEGMSVYCASKFGIIGLTESLADELQGKGVRVYSVCPGGVNTRMYLDIVPEADPKKLIQPEEVAEKVAALCMPDCRTPSGSSIEISGRLS